MPIEVGSDLYFFALMTDKVTQESIHEFKIEIFNHFGCKAALKSDAHITLIPPFRWSKIGLPILMQTVKQVQIQYSSFDIELDGFGHFQSRVIFAQPKFNEHILNIRNQLMNGMQDLMGERLKKNYDFHPHVTIANRDIVSADFPEMWSKFQNRTYQQQWICNEIALLKHNGHRWEVYYKIPFKQSTT